MAAVCKIHMRGQPPSRLSGRAKQFPVSGFQFLVSSFWFPVSSFQKIKSRELSLETRNWKLETASLDRFFADGSTLTANSRVLYPERA